MSKTFVTLFPAATDVHLHKDVGMIPYILQRDYGFRSTLVSVQPLKDAPLAVEQLSGSFFSVWRYLYQHARHIDVLNLYHHSRKTWFTGWWYKKCKPEGILYLKMDADLPYFEELRQQSSFKRNRWFWNFFFKHTADIISCESQDVFECLAANYTASANKLLCQPNGIDPSSWSVAAPEHLAEKEPLILIAGRIGSYQKNHELLLDIFRSIDLSGWRVVFAGPVEPDFQSVITDFFEAAPHLRDIVSFTGMLNIEEMGAMYRRAKLFVLSSRYENFPLVVPEAMYYGCYVISTDVGCIGEILKQDRYGTIVRDARALKDAICRAMDDDALLAECFPLIRAEAARYLWTSLLRPLNERITDLKKERL